MSQAVSISNNKKNKVQSNSGTLNMNTCNKCGGNGYLKTSQNCYRTCLICLGKGLVGKHSENIN